jgi:hypothetical protein
MWHGKSEGDKDEIRYSEPEGDSGIRSVRLFVTIYFAPITALALY